MSDRREFVKYIFENEFDGNLDRFLDAIGPLFNKKKIESWLDGFVTPQKDAVDQIISAAYVPNFRIVKEYHEMDYSSDIASQLNIPKAFEF